MRDAMQCTADQPKGQLILSTVAFMISFAVWGTIAGAVPILKKGWELTPSETSLLVAIPVIVGSLGRIPIGLLTDRIGPRLIMTIVMFFSGICALLIGLFGPGYRVLLGLGFLMGLSGTTFAVGIGHLSHWFPKEKQGSALGLFGMGNLGQSFAVFGVPLLALLGSWRIGFILFGLLSLIWSFVYFKKAKNSPSAPLQSKSLREILAFFISSPMAWVLSAYYFLTFGGFVAMSIYLPTLLRDQFSLAPHDAGMRTAGFVVLATLMRPLGGYLSDQLGAAKILFVVFLSAALLSFLLMIDKIEFFTIGALGFALMAGLGNGAVFKLVPLYFPKEAGAVSGLVGAAGGMGGFFPPLLMGFSLQWLGHYYFGWGGLLFFSLFCLLLLWKSSS